MISWTLQTLAVTAIMAAVVAALYRWSRLSPATVHLLWVLVLVRMVVPPVVAWPWPLSPWWSDASPAAATAVGGGSAPLLRLVGNYAPSSFVGTEVAAGRAAPTTAGAWLPAWSAAEWLLAAWGVSVAVVVLLQLIRIVRMHRTAGRSEAAPPWMQTDADLLGLRLRMTAPVVELTPALSVPVYWNLGRPRLLMPTSLVDVLDREAWQSIFLHELAHHKRRDHWVGWLELVAGCVWWWNPVYWFARRRLRECAELACDAWVVSEMPEHRRTYADALLHVFEGVSRGSHRALAWNTTADIRLGFERRLKMIYAETMHRRLHPLSRVVLVALAVAVVPVWSVEGTPPEASSLDATATPAQGEVAAVAPDSEQGSLEDVLSKNINLEFEDIHLAEITAFLSDYVDVNIAIDYRVVKPQNGIDVVPSPKYVTDGMVPFISLRNVPLSEGLRALCRPLDLGFETTPGFVWITSLENLEKETWPLPKRDTNLELATVLTDTNVSIEFEDFHISGIAEFLAESCDVNFAVDTRVTGPVPKAPGEGEATEASSEEPSTSPTGKPGNEAVTTGMVPYINLKNVTLHQALLGLLRPLNLTYRLEPGFVWISSPEKMAEESF